MCVVQLAQVSGGHAVAAAPEPVPRHAAPAPQPMSLLQVRSLLPPGLAHRSRRTLAPGRSDSDTPPRRKPRWGDGPIELPHVYKNFFQILIGVVFEPITVRLNFILRQYQNAFERRVIGLFRAATTNNDR